MWQVHILYAVLNSIDKKVLIIDRTVKRREFPEKKHRFENIEISIKIFSVTATTLLLKTH